MTRNLKSPTLMDDVCTNFDHSIKDDIATALMRNPRSRAGYSAENFHGQVWFDEGWHLEIWRFGVLIETIHAKTIRGLMDVACAKYGDN